MNETNSLIKKKSKKLKYRYRSKLVGMKVTINRIETIEEDICHAISEIFPEEYKLISDKYCVEGTIVKYDLLDLTFSTSSKLLESKYESGIPLLEKLGFLPLRGEEKDDRDPNFMSSLAKDIDRNKKYIKMFLRRVDRRPIIKILEDCQKFDYNLPPDYLPQQFKIENACITNSDWIWVYEYVYC